jgi:hypothetical protein
MLQKRSDRDDDQGQGSEMAALETARSSAESSGVKATEPKKKDEEHISVFWRVFGGTILSIVALVAMTLYNNLTSSISDLRTDLNREREARAEMVKKEDFNARVTAQYERMRGIDALKVELEGLKEKVGTNTTLVDGVKKDTAAIVEAIKKDTTVAVEGIKKDTSVLLEGVKKDATATSDALKKDETAMDLIKERVSALEAVRKDLAGLDSLKEKLATTTADLKSFRDEVTKLSTEVERNRASDNERKSNRDSQFKQIEETLKDLQKGLQDCREKLARLEGAKPVPGEPALPQPRPNPTSIGKPTLPTPPNAVKPAGGTTTPGSGEG